MPHAWQPWQHAVKRHARASSHCRAAFIRVPYNDLQAVERAAAADPRVRAVWIEVLQGEGGIQVAMPATFARCVACATSAAGC